MSDLFKYTIPAHNAQTSKITGELLEDIKYSKLGAIPFDAKVGQKVVKAVSIVARIDQQSLKDIEADWKELAYDLAQLGLTVVGLIEVAEPLQIGADITNGLIDFKRGHPIVGTLSFISAIPFAGLLGGIPLTMVRLYKCVKSGFRYLGKIFIVFVVKPTVACVKFIWLRRGVLLTYSNKLKRFVENGVKNTVDDIPKVTEQMMNGFKELADKLGKEKVTPINQSGKIGMPSAPGGPVKSMDSDIIDKARREIYKYYDFQKTYGNIFRPKL